MQTLLPLRLIATASNVLFIAYAAFAGLDPIFILHALLLPLNIWRMLQQLQLRRSVRNTFVQPIDITKLMPFMTAEIFEDGSEIFQEGDPADRLYIVIDGEVSIDGMDKTIQKGGIFGEIGMFSTDGCRTVSVRAVGRVSTAWISRPMVITIFERHPDFALALTKLITSRMADNQKKLRAELPSHS